MRIAGKCKSGSVLLVEDTPVLGQTVASIGALGHWEIDVARDGNEAIAAFDRGAYQVVIIDWNLPPSGANGLELCRFLRHASGSVVLIFATSLDSADDAFSAFSAGADDYVRKPLDAQALIARIKGIQDRRPAARSVTVAASGGLQDVTSVTSSMHSHAQPGEVQADCSPDEASVSLGTRAARSLPNLTPQQVDVLGRLLLGFANKEIATALRCSVKNVEYHIGQILRKTRCSSRTQLVAHVWQQRLPSRASQ